MVRVLWRQRSQGGIFWGRGRLSQTPWCECSGGSGLRAVSSGDGAGARLHGASALETAVSGPFLLGTGLVKPDSRVRALWRQRSQGRIFWGRSRLSQTPWCECSGDSGLRAVSSGAGAG
ncbi:hypothetical protein NDU88_007302 [Pleurodeles waltl]|uniref:Uncharacterized protein n=1 Tax=Pleurodeles waltl TaxID=8319 RepID=A0AAV7MHM7_PLEWA|nr:hypothetical protein NDU88_007302 [Pleurodeles waltl]